MNLSNTVKERPKTENYVIKMFQNNSIPIKIIRALDKNFISKKMASCKKKRVQFTLDMNFTNEAKKHTFCERLSAVRDILTRTGSPSFSNRELLESLFNLVQAQVEDASRDASITRGQVNEYPTHGSFLRNSGWFQNFLTKAKFNRIGCC